MLLNHCDCSRRWITVYIRSSEQLEIKGTAAHQHFIECAGYIFAGDLAGSIPFDVKLHRPSHQFFDECRTDAFSSLDDIGYNIVAQSDALPVPGGP